MGKYCLLKGTGFSPSVNHAMSEALATEDNIGASLPEAAGNVIFRSLVPRIGEYAICLIELNQTSAQKEAGLLCNAGSLLHRVSNDHNRILLFN